LTVATGERRNGRVRLVGGQARHPQLHRLRGEMLGRDVEVPRDVDSGALGAAMLAAIATGHVADSRSAAERMVRMTSEDD
jgi:sugar (pentulose or hexulose) kinase